MFFFFCPAPSLIIYEILLSQNAGVTGFAALTGCLKVQDRETSIAFKPGKTVNTNINRGYFLSAFITFLWLRANCIKAPTLLFISRSTWQHCFKCLVQIYLINLFLWVKMNWSDEFCCSSSADGGGTWNWNPWSSSQQLILHLSWKFVQEGPVTISSAKALPSIIAKDLSFAQWHCRALLWNSSLKTWFS